MEFDELQKIWDAQTKEPLWAINENALRKRIQAKKSQAGHITRISEWLTIVVNAGAGSIVLGLNIAKNTPSLLLYLMAAWMMTTALVVIVSRIRRLKNEQQFDRSILGELNHAVSMATYQVRLSGLLRWNMLLIGAFCVLGIWNSGKSVWLSLSLLLFFGVVYYASGWEHRIYTRKKRELETLQEKLQHEEMLG